ncbi:FlaD/FlaE family flagellar protein [Halovivax cerinus]|uniref:FlaD/FlaE family flagellar protein n=1 Tax=Halovivax cerinus TaxID=1487865 RepID=A0ABD5NTW0_9EURY|nr:FlaD/FlaE family flagellar protein [Halovivax cerinus]
MDLTLSNLRELFQNLLGNTGGRRGREREQVRKNRAQQQEAFGDDPAGQGFPGDPGAQVGGQGTGQMQAGQQGPQGGQQQGPGQGTGQPGAEAVTQSADAGAGAQQGDAAGGAGETGGQATASIDRDRPDADELDDDEVVDDLYHRIETLEEELERNGNRLGSIRDAQESVSDDIEEVNDTVRRLLGVYDRLTEQVNPFTGAGEEAEGFGVFGENHEEGEGFGLDRQTTTAGDASVSFEDLREAVDAANGGGEPRRIPFEDELDDDSDEEADGFDDPPTSDDDTSDSAVEVQATEAVDEETPDSSGDGADGESDADVTLSSLADTYAADILVFEWLTEMVRTGGPSATLRAISYYHEIGWIDDEVRAHLEAVLSGPDLDIHVDPERTPEELTAEDHADSYEYIMKLQEVHEVSAEVNP